MSKPFWYFQIMFRRFILSYKLKTLKKNMYEIDIKNSDKFITLEIEFLIQGSSKEPLLGHIST